MFRLSWTGEGNGQGEAGEEEAEEVEEEEGTVAKKDSAERAHRWTRK